MVVFLACAVITISREALGQVDLGAAFLLLCLVFIGRSVPVAETADRVVTFAPAMVLSAVLLIGGPAAAWIALAACAVQSPFFRREDRGYCIFLGAAYGLSAFAAHSAWVYLVGTGTVTASPDFVDVLDAGASAAAFIATTTVILITDHMIQNRPLSETRRYLKVEAIAIAASFPFAIFMAFAYRAFGMTAVPFLAALLLVCAYAVRMTEESRALARLLAAVEELGQASAKAVSTEAALQRFLQLACGLTPFDRAVLWLRDEATGGLTARAAYPEGSPLPPALDGIQEMLFSRAYRRGIPMISSDNNPSAQESSGTPPASWLVYPIMLHGQNVGIAHLIRSISRPFTAIDIRRLSTLVPQAALAIESARVRHLMLRLADIATTDGLTGLMNHRRSYDALREELGRAVRYGRPLAVLMLDLDAFKQFNDTYGHPHGDKLLQAVAEILRTSVRSLDPVGRYGGEEFIVILPETSREDAHALAERIRAAVESEPFDAGANRTVRRTISIGVAAYPEDGSRPEELVERADEALYRAKRAGRNRVGAAGDGEWKVGRWEDGK